MKNIKRRIPGMDEDYRRLLVKSSKQSINQDYTKLKRNVNFPLTFLIQKMIEDSRQDVCRWT